MTLSSTLPAWRPGRDGRGRVDLRVIWRIALPLMVTNAIQSALNLTDTWFIGRLSTDAVAAIGAIYWLMTGAILILGGIGLSAQSFVSQADGAGRRSRASQCAWNSLWGSLATLPFFVAFAWGGAPLLGLFRLDSNIEYLAIEYWEPRLLGAVLGAMSWGLMSFFNGIGATRITLYVAVATLLTNIPANEWFMFELGWGMRGAAWGTNAAQAIGLLLGFGFLFFGSIAKRYRTHLTWRPRWAMVKRQLAVGLPIGVMYGADVLGIALMQLMVTQVGSVGAAATQIVIMLTSLSYMPGLGIATAGTTLVGQAIGAGDRDWAARLGRYIIFFCAAFMLGVAVVILVSGPWLLPRFVSSGDAAAASAVAAAMLFLWPAAAYQMFDGFYHSSSFALRAAGDTTVPAATALLLSWFFFVPLAHCLIFTPEQAWVSGLPQWGLGALGGWLALMCYLMLLGSLMFYRWSSGRWRKIDLWGRS